MIDLKDVVGLPIYLDEESGEIVYDDCVACVSAADVKLDEMVPVLLNKYLKYPEEIYKHFKKMHHVDDSSNEKDKISFDLVKIPFGLLGIEYVKTHIYYSAKEDHKFSCIVQMVNGEMTVILQKNSDEQEEYSINTAVDEIELISIKKGDRLAIPTGYFYTFINTGSQQALFTIISGHNLTNIDYSTLAKEKGLAFYIISKNARLEVVANPKYKVSKRPIHRAWEEYETEKKKKFSIEHKSIKSVIAAYDLYKTYTKELHEMLAY